MKRREASRVRLPEVKVRLTKAEKLALPDWQEQVALFQSTCDRRFKDKQERFRTSLHEGAHAVQYSQFGWNVKFRGPYVEYRDGKLLFVLGGVSPIRLNNYGPLPWQHAMVSIAGYKWAERFTGLPDEAFTIQNDLASLRSDLSEGEDVNEAIWQGEVMLEDQLSQLSFVDELREMVRAYELIVYNTDEATTWGWKEYHPELPGKRYRVIVPSAGYFATLVEHGGELKLVVMGTVLRPGEKLHGDRPKVRIPNEPRDGTAEVVERWNEQVRVKHEEK